jgi:hypothetical protein
MKRCCPASPVRIALLIGLLTALVWLVVSGVGWASQAAEQPGATYAGTIEAWRADREAELRADDGWLTLVGLFWLHEGPNAMGGGDANAVPLPASSSPARLAVMDLTAGVVRITPEPGTALRINGKPASAQTLAPQPGDYDVLTIGSLTFFVIKRGDRFGVRVKDRESEARRTFTGLRWFPIREASRIRARFVAHAAPTSIMIANVLGSIDPWPSPGYAVFTLDGREYRLHAVLDGADAKELFFVFRDLTTGQETYPGGRFLYAAMPVNGEVVLDFNKAHSPPCAFTPFATCPVPPKENHLAVRIEAGELNPHR